MTANAAPAPIRRGRGLDRLRLCHLADRTPCEVSLGEQRAAIAPALVVRRRFLVAA